METISFVLFMELLEKIETLEISTKIFIYVKGSNWILSMKKLVGPEFALFQNLFAGTVEEFYQGEYNKLKHQAVKSQRPTF